MRDRRQQDTADIAPFFLGTLEKDGAQLRFAEYGDESEEAPSLILLHGNGEDSHIFDNHIAVYTPYYRVITMDMRGCGESTRGDGKLDYDLLSGDLFALLNHLQIGMAVILGFGDGANIAIRFTMLHQERVVALILIGVTLDPSGLDTRTLLAAHTTEKMSAFGKAFSRKARTVNEEVALMTKAPGVVPQDLAHVYVPTLVVAGSKDLIKREHSELITSSLPDARLEVIENAGHWVMKDNPTRFDEVTLGFLLEDD